MILIYYFMLNVKTDYEKSYIMRMRLCVVFSLNL